MFNKLRQAFSVIVDKIAYTELSEEDVERIRDDIVFSLVESDVAFEVAEAIIDKLKVRLSGLKIHRGADRRAIITEELRNILLEILTKGGKIDLVSLVKKKKSEGRPFVILFLGPNGHGKTTTIAKMGKYFVERGFKTIIAAADTFRAGAIEQVEKHARKLGIKVIKHKYGADPAAVAFDAVRYAEKHGVDVVLIDTAGRLQSDSNLMEEMKKIKRVSKPDLNIFVGDALTGNDALDQALKFNENVGIDGAVLTKIDADVKGGAAISITYATQKPILFLGTGQNYSDLEEFDPEKYVKILLEG